MEKVKLIIELDADKYAYIQKQENVPILYDDMIATAVLDGKLLQTELEEIKTEITKCYYNDSFNVDGVIVIKEDIDNIFNKHVSELKGINND